MHSRPMNIRERIEDVELMKDIPSTDLFGIFYVRKPDGLKWDSYYRTIDSLRQLFDDENFKKVVHGFYLNIVGNYDSVRISYFVDPHDSRELTRVFQEYFSKNGIEEIEVHSAPHEDVVAEKYGGQAHEQQFRNFLGNYTQIGLELLDGNLLHCRRLFTVYRFQVRQASIPLKGFFEPTFMKYSPSYISFSSGESKQFFEDLEYCPPHQTEWAHMMVNMIVGCDWAPIYYPLSIEGINKILIRDSIGFQIPERWNPQSFEL
jgi:hypothetical protein